MKHHYSTPNFLDNEKNANIHIIFTPSATPVKGGAATSSVICNIMLKEKPIFKKRHFMTLILMAKKDNTLFI